MSPSTSHCPSTRLDLSTRRSLRDTVRKDLDYHADGAEDDDTRGLLGVINSNESTRGGGNKFNYTSANSSNGLNFNSSSGVQKLNLNFAPNGPNSRESYSSSKKLRNPISQRPPSVRCCNTIIPCPVFL